MKDMRIWEKVCKVVYVAAVVMYGVVQPVVIGEYTWWHGLWGVALGRKMKKTK